MWPCFITMIFIHCVIFHHDTFKTFCLLSEVIIIVMEIMVFLSHHFWSSTLPYTYVMPFLHIYSIPVFIEVGGMNGFIPLVRVRNNFQRAFCHWRPFLNNGHLHSVFQFQLIEFSLDHVTCEGQNWYIWISIIHMILQRFGSEFDVNPLQCNRYADSFFLHFRSHDPDYVS